jgi:hypothetical protein
MKVIITLIIVVIYIYFMVYWRVSKTLVLYHET